MPSLTIKDIPEPLLARLRQRATADQRSLNREVIHLLGRVLSEPSTATEALTQRIEAQTQTWQTLAGGWESDLEPAAEIEQIYTARTSGRPVDL